MEAYPEVVAAIVADYMARVRRQLHEVSAAEREEFLREIESHVFESYQRAPDGEDVARILTVLRNIGEPSEIVSERMPEAMVRMGARRSLPLYIVAGVLIALFGIPLGFGGVAVLAGVLLLLAAAVAAYYAASGAILITATVFLLAGFVRSYQPELWDKLVLLGVIQMNAEQAEILEHFSAAAQGFVLTAAGCALGAFGIGMLWAGRYVLRGLRFLYQLLFDWVRRSAQAVRRRYTSSGRERHGRGPVPSMAFRG